MNTKTAWVKPLAAARGLDHLGTQAPCIYQYGQLLPGITNVTDRARYFSFYPWLFYNFENRWSKYEWEEIVHKFRKADCLFTLIAARHSEVTDGKDFNHGAFMVGRDTLVPALRELDENASLKLSTYATRDSADKNRYFKNSLGGLGQYYLGAFKEHYLFTGDARTGVQFVIERAEQIAEGMDRGVPGDLFFEALENDEASRDILDRLENFCPCKLSENEIEQKHLIDLFFSKGNYSTENFGEQRKFSLGLILRLIEQYHELTIDPPTSFDHFLFRAAVYSGFLEKNRPVEILPILAPTLKAWRIYQTNELLSIACQGLFWAALEMLSTAEESFQSVEHYVAWFSQSEAVQTALHGRTQEKFKQCVSDMENNMPALSDIDHPQHELKMARHILSLPKKGNPTSVHAEMITTSLKLLLSLAARGDTEILTYTQVFFPKSYYELYPINLKSFHYHIHNTWADMPLLELLIWLANQWGIATHLNVALRKLRHTKLNTFRVYPSERGLKYIETPLPNLTSPRFSQALQILRDLGLVVDPLNDGKLSLTEKGSQTLEECFGN